MLDDDDYLVDGPFIISYSYHSIPYKVHSYMQQFSVDGWPFFSNTPLLFYFKS